MSELHWLFEWEPVGAVNGIELQSISQWLYVSEPGAKSIFPSSEMAQFFCFIKNIISITAEGG